MQSAAFPPARTATVIALPCRSSHLAMNLGSCTRAAFNEPVYLLAGIRPETIAAAQATAARLLRDHGTAVQPVCGDSSLGGVRKFKAWLQAHGKWPPRSVHLVLSADNARSAATCFRLLGFDVATVTIVGDRTDPGLVALVTDRCRDWHCIASHRISCAMRSVRQVCDLVAYWRRSGDV